ncbi:DsrE family protein [Sulfuricurvum sp.]|uniref:DsrE family protein n=1 Tax=Sulfuricurvum sp. TaxID=2025608 RepID=UPI00261C139E|nr:DsrE family protein [Sulfuricurvum sp.]MDD2266861.1 DsrE family protein [Sulfuricurvum sp.]MDD2783834.1 DsrE family protein [Sulfuricurvum sp.]
MKLINFLFIVLSVTAFPLAASEKDDDVVKVVYQCDFLEADRIHLMLNTINNAVEYYNKNFIQYEIDLVALGPCLQYVMKDFNNTGFEEKPYITQGGPTGAGTRSRLKALQLDGGDKIKIYACKNTMDKNHVADNQIEDFATTTPAGIVKIIDLQRSGYAYIKIR